MSRKVFISYSRSDADRVAELARDIVALGHEAWFDHELSGGQNWWEQILLRIRECEVFVFAVSGSAVDSQACLSEYDYGVGLGKPVLPVMVDEHLSDSLMPPTLAALQRLNYTAQDKAAFAGLNRAISTMPATPPLPATLPPTPPVPASYLFDLKTEIGAPGVLTPERQAQLLSQIKTRLEAGHSHSDVLALIRRFRQRDDIVVRLDRELADLEARLAGGAAPEPGPRPAPPRGPAAPPRSGPASPQPAPAPYAPASPVPMMQQPAAQAGAPFNGAWWIAPILFGIVGGVVAWAAIKDANPAAGKKMLIAGAISSVFWYAALSGG